MKISMNVLNHLGINLYSNTPSVLAEVVANAWDADASRVDITYSENPEMLTIVDDGCGMTEAELNDHYLLVGRERRTPSALQTPSGRSPMGRKGIGKLSLFSIAKKIHVQSKRDGDENAFLMDADVIQARIKDDSLQTYYPEEVEPVLGLLPGKTGTTIQITEFKKQFTKTVFNGLRKRLARRFSIIGGEDFVMRIGGEKVTYADRDYFHKARFLFQYGDEDVSVHCNKLDTDDNGKPITCQRVNQFGREGEATTNGEYAVKGWIGYAHRSNDLDGGDGEDNLNNIAIIVRGKVAQEDILHQFRMGSHASKYLFGEIQADFLDEDGDKEDIATSSRQAIKENSSRYQALKKFIDKELRDIRTVTDKLKAKQGVNKALKFHPKIKEWYDALAPAMRKDANVILGDIEKIYTDRGEDKATLYANGIIAFEKLKAKGALSELTKLSATGPDYVPGLLAAYSAVDEIEAAHYHEIVRLRLQVIENLQAKVNEKYRERIVQEYIFEHLWLLDPAWERATSEAKMEKTIQAKIANELGSGESEEHGRIDIQYKRISGGQVIIELKRPGVRVNKNELEEQLKKYIRLVTRMLKKRSQPFDSLEVISIVSPELQGWENSVTKEQDINSLAAYGIKVITYEELIDNAHSAYAKFIEKQDKVGELNKLLREIQDMAVKKTDA